MQVLHIWVRKISKRMPAATKQKQRAKQSGANNKSSRKWPMNPEPANCLTTLRKQGLEGLVSNIRPIPQTSLIWWELSLHQTHCRKQSVVQHEKFLATSAWWHRTFLASTCKLVISPQLCIQQAMNFNKTWGISRMSPDPLLAVWSGYKTTPCMPQALSSSVFDYTSICALCVWGLLWACVKLVYI